MTKLQFRVLYREFLFRMVDLELLSADALGDSNKLLGQFAALLMIVGILLSLAALGVGSGHLPPEAWLYNAWGVEHFVIATTMLVVGLFAVLSWDSTFPDCRDVLVLAPMPVRARTLFLAKVAAVATALAVTVLLLHSAVGWVCPLALGMQPGATASVPAFGFLAAQPPVDAAGLGPLLRRDLPALPGAMGIVVGVETRGERRVYAYGTARPDSIYQIGSISKTFTALLLAQMVEQGRARLDEPVRALLPDGMLARPKGSEITLLDLATHRSGLPPMPDNFRRDLAAGPAASFSSYHARDLYDYLARHGLGREANPPFVYSNLGFALLGEALTVRSGMPYAELVERRITGPLGLRDTSVALTPAVRARLIQAYDDWHKPIEPWNLDAFAPAGALSSTADDLLTYLEVQMRAATPALRLSQQPRARVEGGASIALAWFYDEAAGTYSHAGALSGYGSYSFFNPRHDYAEVVLTNQNTHLLGALVALHVRQRLAGEPAVALASVSVPPGGVVRAFAAYWFTMLAAGAFIFCCVLGLQGLAAQLLPRRLFLRVSSLLQLSAFCLIVSGYFWQPILAPPGALIKAHGHGWLAWSPSYWFLGLFQQLSGSAALAPLARRAWIGLAVVLTITAVAYALAYFRTLRQIVETPDIVAGSRGGIRWPRLGTAVQTAIVHFSLRTLSRSRLHRIILAFYLGVGSAFVIFLVENSEAQNPLADAPAADPWSAVNEPLLAASVAMLGFAMIGARVAFSIPLDLRANWIFRLTGARRVPECLTGSRCALFLLSAAPVWAASAACCFRLWPWRAAAGHLAVLALLAMLLAELCLHGFHKIPFTCSYLPGKSQVHLAIFGGIALFWCIVWSVIYERQALADPVRFVPLLVGLGCVWLCARWWNTVRARSKGAEVSFEELATPAVQQLGLNRDGSGMIDPPAMT